MPGHNSNLTPSQLRTETIEELISKIRGARDEADVILMTYDDPEGPEAGVWKSVTDDLTSLLKRVTTAGRLR